MSSFAGLIVSEPSTLFISELTGDRNILQLRGRTLPYRPLTFEGGMRAEFTWYPGNPVATVQMLGADEKTTSINGMWKDKFVRSRNDVGLPVLTGSTGVATFNGQRIADVRDLVEIVDAFRMRGQLIELSWDQFKRQGIFIRFRQTWQRREDVEWEMEFQWINRGEPQTPVAFAPSVPDLDISNQISDAVTGLTTIIEAPFALVTTINNEITEIIETIEGAVGSLSDIANKAIDATLSPLEAVRSTLAAIQTIKAEAQAILDLTETVPARALRQAASIELLVNQVAAGSDVAVTETQTQTEAGAITTVSVSSTGAVNALQTTSETQTSAIAEITHEESLEAEVYKRDVRAAARNVRSVAAQREQELEAQTVRVPNVIVFSATADSDLRDVATRFYDNPEEWKSLLIYNNFDSSKLEAGQIVLVPPLTRTQIGVC